MSTIIFVKNLTVIGTHGAHLLVAKPKEFMLDMEFEVNDITQAVSTDDIAYVYDYRRAVTTARRIIEGSSVHLIETLATRIADEVLKNHRVSKLKLTLSKREYGDEFDSGITIFRPE